MITRRQNRSAGRSSRCTPVSSRSWTDLSKPQRNHMRKLARTGLETFVVFVHETVLSLLASRRQQGQNPYEQLQRVLRDNKMISPTQAVPEVASG